MLLTKEVKLKWCNRIRKWYIDKGYGYTGNGEGFIVQVDDLPPSSMIEIEYTCDYCGQIKKTRIATRNRHRGLSQRDCCSNCIGEKVSEAKEISFIDYIASIYDYSDLPYKFIPLSQGAHAIVDNKHYDYLVNLCRWYLSASGYAMGNIKQEDGTVKQVPMHRVIMGCPPEHLEVEHIGDKLLNIEENLRICTRYENGKNMKPYENKSSKYKGVSYHKGSGKWEVRITCMDRLYRIGFFTNEIAAANAYNVFAKHIFGEYARLNDCPYMEESEWRMYNTGKQKQIEDLRLPPCIKGTE